MLLSDSAFFAASPRITSSTVCDTPARASVSHDGTQDARSVAPSRYHPFLSSLVTVRFFHTALYDADLAYDSTSEASNAASGATRIAARFEYDYVGI